MKSRQWNKLTTERCKQFCNEWCCPCNDGSIGCYANDFYEMLCDNSTTAHIFRGEEDEFDKLQEESYNKMVESYDNPEIYEDFCVKFVDKLCEKSKKNFWELLVESYEDDMKRLEEIYSSDPKEEPEPESNVLDSIPIEWVKNKRDELKKEYYDLFHAYTDEDRTKQVQILNDFHAFNTVLRYWEKENEYNKENTSQTD